ncbi:O-antigen ligase family protein [Patescibacteria group bacterium]|nr:O-antigen ligase family protein [Patescibacteria group bacterium]
MTTFTTQLKKWANWLDDHLLIILASILLAFIPLYPKIPLWSPIEQYIVRVRAEDLLIGLTVIVWAIQVLRKKARFVSAMFWMVLAYAVVGLVSTLVAIFVIKTIPLEPLHVGKTLLHYFRYLEYFSLFFVLYSAIKKRSHLVLAVSIFALTVLSIALYGYGQRYFYFPVYSTMNREFSKGVRLYLTQYARVQSTFAGHYDMAAYLVIALPLLLAVAYRARKRAISLGLHFIFWIGTWLLILSASRTPFAAFIAGVGVVILATTLNKTGIKQKVWFFTTRSAIFVVMSALLFYYFGADMTERLSHVVNSQPALKSVVDTLNNQRRMIISDQALASLPLTPQQLQERLPKGNPPSGGISTDDVAAAAAATADVASSVDQPPSPLTPTEKPSPSPSPKPTQLPAGVYEDIPDQVVVATVSATGETTYITVAKPRVYSECALKQELSLCIRQETLWPRAIEGFLSNPITGSGYATLTKENIDQFTEADSTDNNFLRTLGETGLLGFITFYGCVGIILYAAIRNLRDSDYLVSAMSVGLLGGSIGLLLNAIYIDVFAASKVAQTYWALAGLFLGYLAVRDRLAKEAEQKAVYPATSTLAKEGVRHAKAKPKKKTRV